LFSATTSAGTPIRPSQLGAAAALAWQLRADRDDVRDHGLALQTATFWADDRGEVPDPAKGFGPVKVGLPLSFW
jgi:hypothetical protein